VLSRYTVLPWESTDEYRAVVEALVAEHGPQGPTEEHLVEEIAGIPHKQKAEVLPPRNAMALDTLAGVRGEMARLYRLGLNGRIRSDEMTRFIYALKEIRACLEAELLTDVQQRLALLSRDMDNHNGQRVPYQPALTGR
jgi:hypothetical protein